MTGAGLRRSTRQTAGKAPQLHADNMFGSSDSNPGSQTQHQHQAPSVSQQKILASSTAADRIPTDADPATEATSLPASSRATVPHQATCHAPAVQKASNAPQQGAAASKAADDAATEAATTTGSGRKRQASASKAADGASSGAEIQPAPASNGQGRKRGARSQAQAVQQDHAAPRQEAVNSAAAAHSLAGAEIATEPAATPSSTSRGNKRHASAGKACIADNASNSQGAATVASTDRPTTRNSKAKAADPGVSTTDKLTDATVPSVKASSSQDPAATPAASTDRPTMRKARGRAMLDSTPAILTNGKPAAPESAPAAAATDKPAADKSGQTSSVVEEEGVKPTNGCSSLEGGTALVGQRIEVWWSGELEYFPGIVAAYNARTVSCDVSTHRSSVVPLEIRILGSELSNSDVKGWTNSAQG